MHRLHLRDLHRHHPSQPSPRLFVLLPLPQLPPKLPARRHPRPAPGHRGNPPVLIGHGPLAPRPSRGRGPGEDPGQEDALQVSSSPLPPSQAPPQLLQPQGPARGRQGQDGRPGPAPQVPLGLRPPVLSPEQGRGGCERGQVQAERVHGCHQEVLPRKQVWGRGDRVGRGAANQSAVLHEEEAERFEHAGRGGRGGEQGEQSLCTPGHLLQCQTHLLRSHPDSTRTDISAGEGGARERPDSDSSMATLTESSRRVGGAIGEEEREGRGCWT